MRVDLGLFQHEGAIDIADAVILFGKEADNTLQQDLAVDAFEFIGSIREMKADIAQAGCA